MSKIKPDGSITEARLLLRHGFWLFVAVLVVVFLVLAVIDEAGHLPRSTGPSTSGG